VNSGSGGDDLDFNDTEWGLRAAITFPLFEGGAKFAERRQAQDTLASVRTQRRATARTLEQRIRARFAEASGAYDNVGYSRREVEAARRNYELVSASYVLGVDSILDLLDAQNQQLTAELNYTNAVYDFLVALIAAEKEIAFFPFLEKPADVEELLGGLEHALAAGP